VLDQVNDSKFRLQAGIFTRALFKAMRAWDKLEVGGVVIGDVPSYRWTTFPMAGSRIPGWGAKACASPWKNGRNPKPGDPQPRLTGIARREKTRHHSLKQASQRQMVEARNGE
jgi:hypothetical protein